MKTLFFLLFAILPFTIHAQDLYLQIDPTQSAYEQHVSNWVSPNNDGKYVKIFGFTVNNRMPAFICKDKATLSQILPMDSLANYASLVTVHQVAPTLANKTGVEVEAWIRQFKQIYIIQKLPATNQIEVSKVKSANIFVGGN
jgi:hypothetical protein